MTLELSKTDFFNIYFPQNSTGNSMALYPTRPRMVRSGYLKRPQVKTSLNDTTHKSQKMATRTVRTLFITADKQTTT